jgi:hypothetical protein
VLPGNNFAKIGLAFDKGVWGNAAPLQGHWCRNDVKTTLWENGTLGFSAAARVRRELKLFPVVASLALRDVIAPDGIMSSSFGIHLTDPYGKQ